MTERDNMGYHEMIVHVPMLAVGEPKRVLIDRGGDGGSLQQVLRYSSVDEAVVCELDQRVVDLSREHFVASFGDPWVDPRTKLLVRDAFGFLEQNPGQFDVIISDMAETKMFEPSTSYGKCLSNGSPIRFTEKRFQGHSRMVKEYPLECKQRYLRSSVGTNPRPIQSVVEFNYRR